MDKEENCGYAPLYCRTPFLTLHFIPTVVLNCFLALKIVIFCIAKARLRTIGIHSF